MSDPYDVNDQEFEAVLRLDAPKRYEHFVKRISDTERIYVLEEDGKPVILRDETATVGTAAVRLPYTNA